MEKKIIFEEEGTHVRVEVEVLENERSSYRGHTLRNERIAKVLRAAHIKRSLKETRALRQKQAKEKMPKSAGDMLLKGEDDKGRLRYSWKDVEVLVTPRDKREPLPENASKAAVAKANESTPARALRKMKEKVKRMLEKAARGECERIIQKRGDYKSSYTSSNDLAHGPSANTWPTHKSPALGKLDDRLVRSHLREAFSYLNTMKLHHCQNCDEEWPVFTGDWPSGGVATAGPKAGYSETIKRVGWMASTRNHEFCYRCYSSKIQRNMYSKGNLQHLGERHEALSNLTWFEGLLIARVHPVISVVTLTATGLLCYAGHVCNYFQKSFEWFQELPARIGNRKWFGIKRRRSINSTPSDTTQKKPTTANQTRLRAAFEACFRYLPNVYAGSSINHDHLSQYPVREEQEMLEPFRPDSDLTGEIPTSKELFEAWLRFGPRQGGCACAEAILHYAQMLQGDDMRAAVGPDTAWELCCRTLTLADDTAFIGSRTLANLLMYLLDGDPAAENMTPQLPVQMRDLIYAGMEDDLIARGKEIRTELDRQAMKTRWVKQLIHREFDVAREAWLAEQPEAPVDLAVVGAIDEAEHVSVTKEAEDAAREILDDLCKEDESGQRTAPQDCAEAEGSPRLKPAGSSRRTAAERPSSRVIDNAQLPLTT